MLLVASYIFYGSWDWRFLSLIFISTILDYFCGIKIHKSTELHIRKRFLFLSIFINLSILGFFKYFGFFTSSLADLFSLFGLLIQPYFLKVILPIGISFYTFQTMSYTIDIYRKQMQPTSNFLDFALFVAFFPQLVAGPIERARHLLPQILSPRKLSLDKFYEGCYLLFWGLFMKVFVADNLATIVNPIFAAGAPYSGTEVLLASYAFAFQILCDFAGYSTIARGLGKCMGFDIMVNFNLPYFAANPSEFWQRWHGSSVRIGFSFQLVCLGYLIFRASSITQTYNMLISILTNFQLHSVGLEHMASQIVFYIGVLVVVQIVQYCKNDQMIILKSNILVKAIFYCICFYLLIMFGAGGGQEFIYFQF